MGSEYIAYLCISWFSFVVVFVCWLVAQMPLLHSSLSSTSCHSFSFAFASMAASFRQSLPSVVSSFSFASSFRFAAGASSQLERPCLSCWTVASLVRWFSPPKSSFFSA